MVERVGAGSDRLQARWRGGGRVASCELRDGRRGGAFWSRAGGHDGGFWALGCGTIDAGWTPDGSAPESRSSPSSPMNVKRPLPLQPACSCHLSQRRALLFPASPCPPRQQHPGTAPLPPRAAPCVTGQLNTILYFRLYATPLPEHVSRRTLPPPDYRRPLHLILCDLGLPQSAPWPCRKPHAVIVPSANAAATGTRRLLPSRRILPVRCRYTITYCWPWRLQSAR